MQKNYWQEKMSILAYIAIKYLLGKVRFQQKQGHVVIHAIKKEHNIKLIKPSSGRVIRPPAADNCRCYVL